MVSDTGLVKGKKGQLMNPYLNKKGYVMVAVRCCSGLVHRMVAECFIANPNNLDTVNHKDGNKLNNSVENLEWMSYSDNLRHAFDNGLKVIKPVILINLKSGLIQEFESATKCADAIGARRTSVSKVCLGTRKSLYGKYKIFQKK